MSKWHTGFENNFEAGNIQRVFYCFDDLERSILDLKSHGMIIH